MIDSNNEYKSFWTNTVYGKELFDFEQELISKYLTKIFGFNILQIGSTNINYLSQNCKVKHKLVLSSNIHEHLDNKLDHNLDNRSLLYSKDHLIALATDSVDAVILAHALEFSPEPHSVLREIDRVLLPSGNLIILGFNPWSFWGLRSALTNKKSVLYPWHGSWLSCNRVCDWLRLLDYEICDKTFYFFRPYLNSQKILNSMRFMDQIGKILPIGAASFCINAKKKQSLLTPIKAKWQNNIELVNVRNSAEPTMRSR